MQNLECELNQTSPLYEEIKPKTESSDIRNYTICEAYITVKQTDYIPGDVDTTPRDENGGIIVAYDITECPAYGTQKCK